MRERDIFFGALETPEGEAREAYLRGACGTDLALRNKVDELLREHANTDSFLVRPAVEGPATVLGSTPIVETAGSQIGRYRLLQKIGEGGFGVVYMAEQKEPVKRRVALKIIKLGMDTRQVVARFEAERQALAMMDHPHIAKVLDAGATDTGRPYFVMELVKGVPLTQYCDEHQLNTRERLELFIPVCQAIQHAHQKGIIHRDIKPSNVMVTLHDGVPVPKVIDFGIAKATQQELTEKTIFTHFQQFIGTPAYMSPEQAEMSGLDIDTRSDIYSLGVLLYELLVGRTPLDSRELLSGGYDEIRRRIREEEPKKPSTRVSTLQDQEKSSLAQQRKLSPEQLSKELRGDLDWIILKALEKDRTRRYDTANGFALDIRRYLNHEPVQAAPPDGTYLLRKYVRRHRTALSMAALVVGLLIAGTAVSTWQAVRATRAQREAERAVQAELAQKLIAQTKQREAEEQQERANREASVARKAERETQRNLYAAQMLAIQGDWERANLRALRARLKATADNPDRGFEWNLWQQRARQDWQTVHLTNGPISALAYSPDGELLAIGDASGTLTLWDPAKGRARWARKGHQAKIRDISFSSDGTRLVTGSDDTFIRLWERDSGTQVAELGAGDGVVASVGFSRDQRTVVFGTPSRLGVWDPTLGQVVAECTPPPEPISFVSLHPDLQQFLVGGTYGDFSLWDFPATKERFRIPINDPDRVNYRWITDATLTPDGRTVIYGHTDGWLQTADAVTGRPVRSLRFASIESLDVSPEGTVLVIVANEVVKVLELPSLKERAEFRGHPTICDAVAIHPRGAFVASGDREGTLKIWNLQTSPSQLTFSASQTSLRSLSFSRTGERLLTSDWRGRTALWDAKTGREIRGYPLAGPSALFPDDQRLIATRGGWAFGVNGPVVVEVATGRVLGQVPTENVLAVAVSPDGTRFVTAGQDGAARLWDSQTLEPLRELRADWEAIGPVVFSPEGRRIAVGREDRLTIWDAETGEVLQELRSPQGRSAFGSVAFSPDGERVVTGTSQGLAVVWDWKAGRPLFTLVGHSDYVPTVAFSPDGRRIVTGSNDGVVKLWDAQDGLELMSLHGAGVAVVRVAFAPGGRSLASASAAEEAMITVWKMAEESECRRWMTAEEDHRAAVLAQEQARVSVETIPVARSTRARDRQILEVTLAGPRFRRFRNAPPVSTNDPGVIRKWLVLAPIPVSETLDLMKAHIPEEPQISPRSGNPVMVGSAQLTWRPVQLEELHKLGFAQLLGALPGQEPTNSVAYAVSYIYCATPQAKLKLWIGSDDGAQVFLNGREVYRNLIARSFSVDEDEVSDVTLNAGWNVLVMKVINEGGRWEGSARFTTEENAPVPGIQVSFAPEAPGQ
ncbi:MAG: protein kinase [Verrucomicrobia bacterium]|nr:protein kinase [Verrucomicrobiota bacterium]